MRRLTDEILLQTKGGLRGLRYAVRHEARTSALPVLPDLFRRAGLPENPLARVADRVLSRAERAARAAVDLVPAGLVPTRLLPEQLTAPIVLYRTGFPLAVECYAGEDGRRRFVAAHYRGFKAILAAVGADNVLVSEAAIEDAWDAAGRAGAFAGVADAGAAIAVALVRAKPVLRADGVRGPDSGGPPDGCDPNTWCALVAGLAAAVASLPVSADHAAGDDERTVAPPAAAILASAADAVAVRFTPMRAALAAEAPAPALAAVFARLAPYLP